MRLNHLVKTTVLCLFLLLLANPADAKSRDVKLVLQITIDQLRGDLPLRFKSRFTKNGFRFLMDRGAVYTNAHFIHADTETAPGHATLVTGGTPAQHGITNSEWWDYEKGKVIYAVEDSNSPLLVKNVESTPGTTTKEKGRSPANLLSSTIADEMFNASERRCRVIAISGKDRGAIIPGGRSGKAFWLARGKFITSAYYGKEMPAWAQSWNDKKIADTYRDKSWSLLQDRNLYSRKDLDNRLFEGTYKHLGRTMPKRLYADRDSMFYKGLRYTPVGDELVLDFAKHAVEELELGQRDVTDYLSISFSSTDYVGHIWGVGSLEAEDNLLRVDKNLANLFAYIDKKVGLKKTLVVLSADHGVAEIAEHIATTGFPSRRIPSKTFKDYINRQLKERFSVQDNLVRRFVNPYIYLNLAALKKADLDIEEVEEAAATAAMSFPGITFAVSRSDLLEGELTSETGYCSQIRANFNPRRSGHVHVVVDQFVMFGKHKTNEPGEHGSVWPYDTFVPIMFAGPGIKTGVYSRRVGPHDIAPTIASLLGIKPPSGCIGNPLLEVCD